MVPWERELPRAARCTSQAVRVRVRDVGCRWRWSRSRCTSKARTRAPRRAWWRTRPSPVRRSRRAAARRQRRTRRRAAAAARAAAAGREEGRPLVTSTASRRPGPQKPHTNCALLAQRCVRARWWARDDANCQRHKERRNDETPRREASGLTSRAHLLLLGTCRMYRWATEGTLARARSRALLVQEGEQEEAG